MAKIKFGMMMTDARGKLGGQVFSKNRSGAYVRTKVTPVNPQTVSQQRNRSLLGSVSSSWSTLEAPARDAWNKAVESWQRTNVFGDLEKPSGKNLFSSLNKNRSNYYPELPLLLLPPQKVDFSAVIAVGSTIAALGVTVNVQLGEGFDIAKKYRVRATPGLSAGTSYVKNHLRDLGVLFTPNETGLLNLRTAYNSVMGWQTAGLTVGFEVAEVAENGQIGVPSIVLTYVVA